MKKNIAGTGRGTGKEERTSAGESCIVSIWHSEKSPPEKIPEDFQALPGNGLTGILEGHRLLTGGSLKFTSAAR